jgi:hypothetical protein
MESHTMDERAEDDPRHDRPLILMSCARRLPEKPPADSVTDGMPRRIWCESRRSIDEPGQRSRRLGTHVSNIVAPRTRCMDMGATRPWLRECWTL